ncbi:hypothetical protein BX661DRAFT_1357 [Kickxella alabastrina]|uniref:uncharacterized protein n=1 Tax=Kickxella alabastrina TaxID=61397 RepID=UPI00221F8105|nr:uncharacterized protein BX661DRAFT_1357 [Kickxella alabastrina]KAI7834517.1 hypothetical protein BX661DRAFT_1357 [Kickxella alabastrina]
MMGVEDRACVCASFTGLRATFLLISSAVTCSSLLMVNIFVSDARCRCPMLASNCSHLQGLF